jgi:hypothetical protein
MNGIDAVFSICFSASGSMLRGEKEHRLIDDSPSLHVCRWCGTLLDARGAGMADAFD